nr:hypothetical protein [Tanacetum cinerariifolium]
MTTPNITSSTDSQMHNNIMAAGSRDRPPMLASGRYPQWRLRFLRYVDTRANGEALWKCILSGPYKPTTVLVQVVEASDNFLAVPEHTTVETPLNMSLENKAHFLAEKEAIHLILTGIGDDIYSTVDACQTAQEMWEAIERLQQGESLNIQDVKTNLFWEFRKFTSHDGETMESYYTRFYKLMNEMIRNNLTVTTMQFGTQRTMNVAGTREKLGSRVVQKTGIQYFSCKEYGHFAKECRKLKRYDWLANTDEEVDEQEWEAHYSYMAKIQEVPNADSGFDYELVEQNEQNDVESDDERVTLANLIANLKLDVDENKKIQKQLKKANTTLAQELKECKAILAETSKSLGESNSAKQTEFEKYKAFNDRTIDYDKLKRKLIEALGQLAHKDTVIREDELQCMYLHKVKECDCLAQKLSKQTESVSKKVHSELLQRFAKVEKHSISLEIALQNCKEHVKNDTVCDEKASNVFRKEREQYFKIQDLKAQMQDKNIAISELKKLIEKGKGKSVDTKFDRPSVV